MEPKYSSELYVGQLDHFKQFRLSKSPKNINHHQPFERLSVSTRIARPRPGWLRRCGSRRQFQRASGARSNFEVLKAGRGQARTDHLRQGQAERRPLVSAGDDFLEKMSRVDAK